MYGGDKRRRTLQDYSEPLTCVPVHGSGVGQTRIHRWARRGPARSPGMLRYSIVSAMDRGD